VAANDAKHAVEITLTLDELKRQAQNAEAVIQNAVKRMSAHLLSIKMDDSHVNTYYKNLEVKQKQFAQQQQLMQAAAVKASRQSTMQSVQLAQQVQDFGIQVAGGQNPLLAAVQQGSQLHYIYGGLGNAMRALLSLITPVNVGIAALAAAAYVAYKAFMSGQEALEEYNKALQLTGNAAGATAGDLEQLVQARAQLSSFKSGDIREAITGLAATGKFDYAEINRISEAVLNYARLTGKSEKEVAQNFSKMATAPASFVREMMLANGGITAAEVERVRILEESGKKQEAAAEAQKLVIRRFGEGTKQELSGLASALSSAGKAWDTFWQKARGAYVETPNEKLGKIRTAIEAAEKELAISAAKGDPGLRAKQIALSSLQKKLQTEINATLDQQNKLYQDGVEKKREANKLDEKDLRNQSATAAAALEAQRRELQMTAQMVELKYQITQYEKDLANAVDDDQKAIIQGNIDLLKRKEILIELDKLNDDYAQAFSGVKNDPSSQFAAEKELLIIYGKIVKKWQSLFGLKDPSERFGEVTSSSNKKLNDDRLKELQRYNKDAEDLARDLNEKIKEIDASYITDVTAKANLELEIEAEKYRKKIELAEMGSDARKQAEEAYLNWLAAKQGKIFDDFQRRTDAMRGMSEGIKAYLKEMEDKGKKAEELTKQTLQGIEDSLVSLVTTGKLNARSLINTIIAEFYRLRVIKPLMAEIFGSGGSGSGLFGSLFSFLGGGSFGGGLTRDDLQGFSSGGYTGVGGVTEPAGIVHKGEFVMPKSAVDKIGLSKLMAMKNGGGGDTPVINISIDSSTDRAQVSRLVAQGVQAGISTYHNQVSRGLV
jgi:lambda family phage tail tape measure protein